MIQQKPVVIRNEGFGLLIWSPILDSYFLPEQESINEIKQVIERKNKNIATSELYQNINPALITDLVNMGFDNNIREINQPLEKRLSAPLDMYYDYTHACNLNCPPCYNLFANRNITMSDKQIIEVLTQASTNGIMRTHLAGGEPMINLPRLDTYLRTANDVGMNISVTSNGTLLTEQILRTLLDNEIITLTLSLDGHNSESNDAIRGNNNFRKVRSNAKMASSEIKARNSKTKLQYKTIHMFNTPLETYESLIVLSIEDGINRLQFHNPECSVLHPQGHYSLPEVIDGYYERVLHLKSLEIKYKGQIEIWKPWNPLTGCADIGLPGYHGCIGGQELVAIDATGEIRPCLMDKYKFGNLFKDWNGNFSKFWRESEQLKKFHESVNYVDSHCDPCDVYTQCRGGRKTRVIVNNKLDENSENISLDHLTGYDPYCAKDYLEAHTELQLPQKRTSFIPMNKHKQIFIAHSL